MRTALAALALGLALSLTAVSPAAAGDLRGEFSWQGRHHEVPFHLLRRGSDRHGLLDRRGFLAEPPFDVRGPKRRQRVIIPSLGRGFDNPRGVPGSIYKRSLSPGVVVDRLLRRGFERIRVVLVEPGLFRVHAVDPAGRRVRLLVDSFTGRILRAKVVG